VLRILGSIVLLLALIAFLVPITVAGVLRGMAPETVLQFAPWDARANAVAAEQHMLHDQSPAAIRDAQARALVAFNHDSTALGALTTLGFVANAEADMGRAASIFRFVETLSRRDTRTELWLIEYAVQRNDVHDALHHYDVALRTSYEVWPLLFTTLATASSQPNIAGDLNALLHRRPPWWRNFLNYALGVTGDPTALAAMASGLLDPAVEEDRNLAQRISARLISLGRFDLAWSTYARMPGQQAAAALPLRNPNFDRPVGFPPFDWDSAGDPSLLSEVRPIEGSSDRLALFLPETPAADGDTMRQLVKLAPGRYRFRAETGGGVDDDPLRRPSVGLVCAGSGGSSLLNLPFSSHGAIGGDFVVPRGCDFQWMSIRVRQGPDGAPPQSGWIRAVAVAPLDR
jgi:hypothetical protein